MQNALHLKLQLKLLLRTKVKFETDYYNVHAALNKAVSFRIFMARIKKRIRNTFA